MAYQEFTGQLDGEKSASMPTFIPFNGRLDNGRLDSPTTSSGNNEVVITNPMGDDSGAAIMAQANGNPSTGSVMDNYDPSQMDASTRAKVQAYADQFDPTKAGFVQAQKNRAAEDVRQKTAQIESQQPSAVPTSDIDAARPAPGVLSTAKGIATDVNAARLSVGAGLLRAYADAIGDDDLAVKAETALRNLHAESQSAHPTFESAGAEYAYQRGSGLAKGLTTMASALGASALAGPEAGVAAFAVPTAAETYGEKRADGFGVAGAAAQALSQGGIAGATMMIPMQFIGANFGKQGIGGFVSGLVARDVPMFEAQAIGSSFVEHAGREDETLGDWLKTVPAAMRDAAIDAALFSAAVGGAHGAKNAAEAMAPKSYQIGKAMQGNIAERDFNPANNEATARQSLSPDVATPESIPSWQIAPIPARSIARPTQDPVQATQEILSAPDVDTAIAAAQKSIEAPISTSAADQLQSIRPLADDMNAMQLAMLEAKRKAEEVRQTEFAQEEPAQPEITQPAPATQAIESTPTNIQAEIARIKATRSQENLMDASIPEQNQEAVPQMASQNIPDRRQDNVERRRVDAMSPDEMRRALLTSDLTGLPNKRAFEEHVHANPQDKILFGDLDDFKAMNAKLGHEGADQVLRTVGEIKAQIAERMGVTPFHRSGDEFLATNADDARLNAYGKELQDTLANTTFHITLPDGAVIKHKGIGFSYGTDQNVKFAESRSLEQKAERKQLGLRTGQRDTMEAPELRGADNQDHVAGRDGVVNQGLTPLQSESQKIKQRAQTNTPEFKRWFGNSKVVDADGWPLVVYHGTAGDFDAFDKRKVGSNYQQDKKGFFFTSNPKEAGWAADDASEKGGSANVMPVYLEIKNPLELRVPQGNKFSASAWFDNTDKKAVLVRAHKEKRDGIIVRGHGNDAIYIVFTPEKIKSAIGNNGNFDPNSIVLMHSGLSPIEAIHHLRNTEMVQRASEKLAESLKVPRAMVSDLKLITVPMAEGSDVARKVAKNYANQERRSQWQWKKFDDVLTKNFSEEQLAKMWDAADEENDLRRDGIQDETRGLGRLNPEERKVVETLHAYGEELIARARDNGMFEGEGVPYWTPRMAVMVGENGEYSRPIMKGEGGGDVGRNVTTSASSLKQRKYLTSAETEAAMKVRLDEGDKTAQLVRNIRAMPMAMARLERAIAGRELINQIKAIGQATGSDTVLPGAAVENDGYFTLDHPAFKTWRPDFKDGEIRKDENGDPIMVRVPIKISNEFRGPLKAVMSTKPGEVYLGLMALKSKSMGLIMYSPIIHNAVEWGRAVPAMDTKGKLTLGLYTYVTGNRAKHDPIQMREAIYHGLVPIGGRGQHMDIAGIMEDPTLQPGRSWTAQVLAAPVSLISERGATNVKKAVDAAGKFWHETLLWDRVADLQMGLYVSMKSSLINKGQPENIAGMIAAHFANRYAGALPREAMSEGARQILNLTLFSRTFTMGNLGAMKDMIAGLPKDVQAQIKMNGGELALKSAQSEARKKAIATFIIDVGLMYVANSLMQDWFEREKIDGWSGWLNSYVGRGGALQDKLKSDPVSILAHPFNSLESLSSTGQNEAGKEERIKWGEDSTGTEVYVRLPTGKIGEEFSNYANFPSGTMKQVRAKFSTFLRPLYETITNDKGVGQKVYDDSKDASTAKNVGKVVVNFLKAQVPSDQIAAAYDLTTGHGDDMDVKKIIGPLVGLTFSKGAPGGPAVGEMYAANREHQDKVISIMPDVKRAIKLGEEDRARELMEAVGMTPREISVTLNHIENPESRLSMGALRQFNKHATDEEKERMNQARR